MRPDWSSFRHPMSNETSGSPHSATPRHEHRLELATGKFGMVTLAELPVRRGLSPGQCSHLAMCGGLPPCQEGAAGCRPSSPSVLSVSLHTRKVAQHTFAFLHCQAFFELKNAEKSIVISQRCRIECVLSSCRCSARVRPLSNRHDLGGSSKFSNVPWQSNRTWVV